MKSSRLTAVGMVAAAVVHPDTDPAQRVVDRVVGHVHIEKRGSCRRQSPGNRPGQSEPP